jgi:hypothetical protein
MAYKMLFYACTSLNEGKGKTMAKSFKKCTCCGNEWAALTDLIRDEQVQIIGYQAAFTDSYEGLFFFAHRTEECGTTIAVPVSSFVNLYEGPEFTAHLECTELCNGLCHSFFDFGGCSKECDMRWVRDVIEVLVNRGPEEVLARLEEVEPQQQCA